MAGAGFKTFNTGDVLTSSDVNTYLMQQTVMVFADASARTTALSGVLAEGMLSYLADTNATEVYDGSSWVSVSGTGDITAVTTGANSGLAGGVTTGNADIKINFASKGQLAVGTGSGTTDFLNVGTNGYYIVADSAETTGLKWAAASTPSFSAWTPTWTNVTVGNGTVTAQYATNGDLVFGYLRLDWGSTTSQSGDVVFTLPVNCTSVSSLRWGIGLLTKSGEPNVMTTMAFASTTQGQLRFLVNYSGTGTYVRDNDIAANSPLTWGSGSTFGITFWYRKA